MIDETYTIKDIVRSSRPTGQSRQSILNSRNLINSNLTQPSSNKTNTALYWVENSLHIPRLTRNYFNSILTCQTLRDHNSFTPKSISLRIDMNRKLFCNSFFLFNKI